MWRRVCEVFNLVVADMPTRTSKNIQECQLKDENGKNRDLKPRVAILVEEEYVKWHSKLSAILFAMNSVVCKEMSRSHTILQFGRELRTMDEVVQDFKVVLEKDNFVSKKICNYHKRHKRRN
ncbi:hypothetical protein CDAR_201081 [Caerostris darwini]|uniref:Uncharacterized protein n=1 Tax=Caerostris darwini TaxID=1538125 RepID=A0AAV4P6B5_9ARAC|nr:hypothetical protein CDAR_201081 [Caerostris darwini]